MEEKVVHISGQDRMQELFRLRRNAKSVYDMLIDCYGPADRFAASDVGEARAYLEGIESAIRVIKGGMGK